MVAVTGYYKYLAGQFIGLDALPLPDHSRVNPYNPYNNDVMKLLVTYNIPREPFQNLPADWEITFPEKEEFSKTELLRILPDYDIMLAIFHAPIDREIIDAGKKLKLISNYGVGYNNIDITYAREKGIAVTNTPKAVNSPTAELALALMLSAAAGLPNAINVSA